MSKVQLLQTEWIHKLFSWFEFLTLVFTCKVEKVSLVILAIFWKFDNFWCCRTCVMQILSQNLLSCLACIPYIYNKNDKFTMYMSCWYYDHCVSWCYKKLLAITQNYSRIFLSLRNNWCGILCSQSGQKNSFFKIWIRKKMDLRFSF